MVGVRPRPDRPATDNGLWIGCVTDLIARPDLGGFNKALWVLFIILFPLIGSLVYVIVRLRGIVGPPGGTGSP